MWGQVFNLLITLLSDRVRLIICVGGILLCYFINIWRGYKMGQYSHLMHIFLSPKLVIMNKI